MRSRSPAALLAIYIAPRSHLEHPLHALRWREVVVPSAALITLEARDALGHARVQPVEDARHRAEDRRVELADIGDELLRVA